MEGVAGLEPAAQELARPGLRGRGIHGQPFGGKTSSPLEAPVGVGLGDFRLRMPRASEVLEQPPANDLADLGLVNCDQVAERRGGPLW